MRECLSDFDLHKVLLPDVQMHNSKARAALSTLVDVYTRDYPAGSILKLEGEQTSYIFVVVSGWLLTSKTLSDGHCQVIDVIVPGGILDTVSANLTTSALDVETLTDSSIALIPRRNWRRACEMHPELVELNHKVTGAALARISERVLRLGKAPAETMIAYVLCELCLRSSARGLVDGTKFHIPMTQQRLGDLCGLSAVHICRTLRRLGRNDVLSVTDHMDIVIHDMDAMARIADIDIETLRDAIIEAA